MYLADSPLFDVATAYAKRGLHVFPCHTLEGNACSCGNASCNDIAKHPLTERGVYDATTDTETLNRFFAGDYASANIALATGETSGVFVLDVDDRNALASLESANGTLPKTWIAETGSGGRHYYFRFTDQCRRLKNAVKFAGSLDVRTTGGYVLLPPSLHKSGKRYRWLVSPDDCEVAGAPDWLLSLIPSKDDLTAQTAKPNSPNSHALTIQRATTLAERATLYLAQCPPAVSYQGGHCRTYAVVCRLVELFGELTDDELLAALQTWNERCSPPWKEHELRHKLADARANTKVTQQTKDDLTSSDDADALPTLDASAYVGLIGDIVQAIAPETEADSAGVLLTLLACVGNAIGKTPTFSVGGGSHHANLFVCLVGETSSGKGQAWDVCDYLMRRVDDAWRNDCIAYGLSSGEGLVERIADPIPDDANASDVRMEDYDPQAWDKSQASKVIVIPNVQRLLCLETEFARPITAMRREGSTLSSILRSAWDGQTLEVLTRGKSKLRASNAYVSVVAHITPSELRKLLASSVETTNGFANRFLWAFVRWTKDLPSGGNVSVLDRFVEPLRKAIEHAKTIGTMTRSADAEHLWNASYPLLRTGHVKATERGRPQVLRLAMTYALCDGSPTIQMTHLQAALSVWRYCEDSALMFFDDNTLASRLRQTIRQRPGIMRGELRLAISHNTPTKTFDDAIGWLLKRGDIVCVPVFDTRQADCYYPSVATMGNRETLRSSQSEQSEEPVSPNSHRPTNDDDEPPASEPNSPVSHHPLTLSELIEWKNANAVRFHRLSCGRCWVTNDCVPLLTPAIEQAINANQDALAVFAGVDASYSGVSIDDAGDDLLGGERVTFDAYEGELRKEGIDVERFKRLHSSLVAQGFADAIAGLVAGNEANNAPMGEAALSAYVQRHAERWRDEYAWANDLAESVGV